jgi:hypothetical protein
VAAVVGLGVSTVRAGSVLFTFHGQIKEIDSLVAGGTLFKVGDPFTLVLDYTPDGPTPCYGYYLGKGDSWVNPATLDTINNKGEGPPYWDIDFRDPGEFQKYCRANISLTGSTLNFVMWDEGIGPSGSVTVGPDFPKEWISDMSEPLPGGVKSIQVNVSGLMDFNAFGFSETHIIGEITGDEIATVPLPPAFLLGLLGMAGLVLYRRRSMR